MKTLIFVLLITFNLFAQDSQFISKCEQITDVVDTGTDVTLSSGVRTLYTSDGGSRTYIHGAILFDSLTSIINNGLTDRIMHIKWTFTLNSAQSDKRCMLELIIDDDPEIPIEKWEYLVDQQNTDIIFTGSTSVYTSSYSIENGFKIYLTTDNDMTLKNKSILIME